MKKLILTSHVILCILLGIAAHAQQEPGIESVYKRTGTTLISEAIKGRGYNVVSSDLIVDAELLKIFRGFRILNATLATNSKMSQISCKVQFNSPSLNVPKESDKYKVHIFIHFCNIQDKSVASDLRAWDLDGAPNVFKHIWNYVDLTAEEVATISQSR